ncbi:HAD family hydrolase [Orrella marina]|uniref:HAD family hydrolase n=1 Tax=Orrella marina TaxID=2163011 RepID=A0A2R4XKC6_9BURK|nr:HAD family hydrolase [Orrella marina]
MRTFRLYSIVSHRSIELQPLNQLDPSKAAAISTVLCDIDDTVTTEGMLTARAYQALEDLGAAGVRVIPITGRPAGWCDHIARMWPVFAVVGENGAFYMRYDRHLNKMFQHFWAPADVRRTNRQKLDELADKILQAVPGCALASDQPYRIADLAVDFCEDVSPLNEKAIDQIVDLFVQAGAQAKVSSIHVNGWFGNYDKLTMTETLFERELPAMLPSLQQNVLFIGDSANDAPMFGHFALSVGVANVNSQIHRIQTPPRFVCQGHSGDGFVEMARYLLNARGWVRQAE